jgi:hypothetical protein
MRLAGSEIDIFRVPVSRGNFEGEAEVWMPPQPRGMVICCFGAQQCLRIRCLAHDLTERGFGVALIDRSGCGSAPLSTIVGETTNQLSGRGLPTAVIATEELSPALTPAEDHWRRLSSPTLILRDADLGNAGDEESAVRRVQTWCEDHLIHTARQAASAK